MRNIIDTKRHTWANTTGKSLLQGFGCIIGFLLLMLLWLSKVGG